MNKKVLLILTVGAGVVAATSLLKTEKLNSKDREKVDEYKKFLEEKGYIQRSSNKTDRRVVYVKLTEEGKLYLEEQNIKFKNFTCKVVEKMGEEDTDNLIRLFDKLYNIIEEIQSEQ